MKLLESPDGLEKVMTQDVAGYDGWQVLSEDAPMPPSRYSSWDRQGKAWQEDTAAREASEKQGQMRNPQALLDTIEALQAEIVRLEQKIEEVDRKHSDPLAPVNNIV